MIPITLGELLDLVDFKRQMELSYKVKANGTLNHYSMFYANDELHRSIRTRGDYDIYDAKVEAIQNERVPGATYGAIIVKYNPNKSTPTPKSKPSAPTPTS